MAKNFLIVLLVLVVGVLVYTQKNPTNPVKSQESSVLGTKIPSWQEVPEMKEILDEKSQETRLKAARKLVERVDVETALEILEHSPLPHTGEGHLVVHQVGFFAYQKYGTDSILKCKDYFLYACYHGTIIEAASDQGFASIVAMTDKCKASPVRHFQCVHAAGHSILAFWNYDLPKALETCDELYEKDQDFPEALTSCHNGAFMENLFGVHDWGTGKEVVRDWLSDDSYFPCNYFGDKYQKGCWLNQAARIYQMNQGDVKKTAQVCEGAGQDEYVNWCMDNLARQIHPLTMGDVNKVFTLCKDMGEAWYGLCLVVNAGSYYSVGGRDEALGVCKQIDTPTVKDECYQRVISQIASDPIEKGVKTALCKKIELPFNQHCQAAIGSIN